MSKLNTLKSIDKSEFNVVCHLTDFQIEVSEWVIRSYNVSEVSISFSPPGFFFKSKRDAKDFIHLLEWDYSLIVLKAFTSGKIKLRKYESIIEAVNQLCGKIEKGL